VGGFPYAPDEWRWASACFPIVGAVVGAVAAGVYHALRPVGPLGAALLAIGVSLLVTGAFHEDGFADTSDALGGAYDREKIFVILKDSRIGTFGASAVVVSIAGRAALLAQVDGGAFAALVLAGAAARAGAVWQMAALPYVTPEGSRSRDVSRGGIEQAAVGTVIALVLAAALVGHGDLSFARAGADFAGVAAVGLASGWRYAKRAGGLTGDFLGATEQLGEIVVLIAMAWGGGW
jgi:adenosylcobinamide-GDP ribazoletransferase